MKGNFYENERVALFIDGANLYSAARALGFDCLLYTSDAADE